MKRYILIIISLLVFIKAEAQSTQSIFEIDHLYYYGLDFSNARFTGFAEETSAQDVKDALFHSWNQVVLEQPEKFSFRTAFRKKVVYKDISAVEKKNKTADPAIMYVDKSVEHIITPEAIEQIVKSYEDTIRKEGIGVVFIIEYFSKPRRKGCMHVVFFDNATRKVILSKRMMASPSGFGLRNYWINTVHKVLDNIDNNEYNRWKQQAAKKKETD